LVTDIKNKQMRNKIKISVLVVAILSLGYVAIAQQKVSLSLHHDIRLGLIGDDIGNEAGTINILARLKMQGHQQKQGYIVVFPEFEYAEIEGNYKRYSANVGYTFNNLILEGFETSAYIGWGFIDRYSKNFFSFGGSGEIAYKLNDTIKVSIIGQFTERKDLKWMYNDNAIRFSGFAGLEINLN